MKARAPGKMVLSGAYAVLEGAPALVLAVDRYVLADASRGAEYQAEEVVAAVSLGSMERPIWYDVSALREGGADGSRKLGLGSSAAIVVACIAASDLAAGGSSEGLAERVFPHALAAHRTAQPRGSGIDVAASCFGGVVKCTLDPCVEGRPLQVQPHTLPADLHIEVFASDVAASTAGMLAAVQDLRSRRPEFVAEKLDAAASGAQAAVNATEVDRFVAAMRTQYRELGELGVAAGIDIVGEAVAALNVAAAAEGACFGPSGAGGGDVALFVGGAPASEDFRARAARAGLCPIALRVGVDGVGAVAA